MPQNTAEGAPPARRRGLLRDAVTLAVGGALAQAIAVGVSPILARLYTPEDFGTFAVFAFIISVCSAVVCLSYEAAIVLPSTDDEARHVTMLAITIAAVVSVAALGLSFAGSGIGRALNSPALTSWLGLVPLSLLGLGVYQALSYWFNRKGQFAPLATSRVVQSGTTAGVQALGGFAAFGAGGLIAGQLLGQVASAGFLWQRANRQDGLDARRRIPWDALARVLKRYHRFPLYTGWGTLTVAASYQIVPVLLSRGYGPGVAGFYFFGYRLVSAGVLLASSSISQVLYQRAAADLNAGERVTPLLELVVARLVIVSVVGLATFALLAPQAFALVFGAQWTVSGSYMVVVAPMFAMQMITSPVSVVLFLFEKQHVATAFQVLLLLGAVASLTAGGWLGLPAIEGLALYAAVQCAIYVAYFLVILRVASSSPVRIARQVVSGRWLKANR